MTGNLGYKIDLWLLGENHLYQGEGVGFDPEGLLSTLPAIGNVVAGYIVGRFIQENGKTYEVLAKLLVAGACLVFMAFCWDLIFPINKKLWTSSFVLLTTGFDCIILAIVMYAIDFLHLTKWTTFFEIVGKNPLVIYLFSELLAIVLYMIHIDKHTSMYGWLYQNIFNHAGTYFGSLLFAVVYMLVCWLVGYGLDQRKIYVRV